MPSFAGNWKLANHDSLDAVLDKLQIPADKRPPGQIPQLDISIKQDGDNFEITTTAQRGTRTTSFAVGTQFETELLMGTVTVKVTASWDGDSLVLTGEKGAKLIRQIVGSQLVSTIDVGGTVAKFYFNKA
ncbi:fatty acid-binding protein type 3-like [Lytechinus variegatus]|uniref:fatty acid-binding protein type 3-like n=1 Tax=Lytechinus variegatus TaxID=7654 RepID=UPI001BB0F190|nr:fatty acid-binding protein type 3-like [Lytechinus variegatus]